MHQNDLTDDELAAVLAAEAWKDRRFVHTNRRLSPRCFVARLLDTDPEAAVVDRGIAIVRQHAFDETLALARANYDGGGCPDRAFVIDYRDRAMLAYDYNYNEGHRIIDFIQCRGHTLPQSLAEKYPGYVD